MYREQIMDHYKRPRNTGELDTDYRAEGENESCGDHVEVFLDVQDGEIKDFRHRTEGCAICTAATSILSEQVVGKTVEEVEGLDRDWMLETLDTDISPMRVKCAVLGLKTAQQALSD